LLLSGLQLLHLHKELLVIELLLGLLECELLLLVSLFLLHHLLHLKHLLLGGRHLGLAKALHIGLEPSFRRATLSLAWILIIQVQQTIEIARSWRGLELSEIIRGFWG